MKKRNHNQGDKKNNPGKNKPKEPYQSKEIAALGIPHKDHGQKAAKQGDEHESPAKIKIEIPKLGAIEWFTFVLVIVGAIQAWSFIESERAFLIVDDVSFVPSPATVGKPLKFALSINNGGKSVAVVKDMRVNARINKLPENPSYEKLTRISESPILPGTKGISLFEPTDGGAFGIYTQEMANAINAGNVLHIFGYITYTDQFDFFGLFDRTTGFCYRYRPDMSGTPIQFATCEENEYTYTK